MPVRLAVPRRTCGDGCRYPVRPGAADLPIGDASLLRLLQGRPDPDAAAAFAAGKAVVFDRDLVRDGALTLDVIPRRKKGGERRSITVPAVVAPAADPRHTAVAVLPPAALGDAGLTPRVRGFLLGPAHWPAPATESRLGRDLMTIHQAAALHVERGYERDARPELWALTVAAVVVILGATFAATGLAAADMRPDLATMAAVGATPRLRRVVVAGQALFITGAGALVGLAAGVVAGLALAWSTAAGAAGARVRYVLDGEFLTAIPPHTPVVEVPWPYLAIVVIGLPPLAALVVGLCTRTRPALARRPT